MKGECSEFMQDMEAAMTVQLKILTAEDSRTALGINENVGMSVFGRGIFLEELITLYLLLFSNFKKYLPYFMITPIETTNSTLDCFLCP